MLTFKDKFYPFPKCNPFHHWKIIQSINVNIHNKKLSWIIISWIFLYSIMHTETTVIWKIRIRCFKAWHSNCYFFMQKIPKWWIWCYWICPTAWSLNGLLTSQYGDIEKEVLVFGERKSVGSFLRDYYGFRHDRLSLVAVVLIVYPIVYASLFAYFIKKMNYQKR